MRVCRVLCPRYSPKPTPLPAVFVWCKRMHTNVHAYMQVWTIVFSMFYSLVFFMSMCAVFGPTGEVGAFYTLCGLLKKDKKTP